MSQPSQDKTKILYDAVSKDYDIGTYDDFKVKLQNPEKRKAFYSVVGAEYNLGSLEEFESKVVKKKESTSVSPQKSSASVQTNGSSVTQDIDPKTGFPKIDTNGVLPDFDKMKSVKTPQPKMKTFTGFSDLELKSMSSEEKPLPVIDKSIKEKINSPEAIAKRKEFQRQEIEKYRNATKLQEAEKLETQQELDAKTNQESVWNNIKALGTKATNAVSDLVFKMTDEGTTPKDLKISTDPLSDEKKQAKEELLSEGIKSPSKVDIENKAKEIYTNNVNLEKKQQKINTYLESVEPKVKSALKIDANERFTSLSKEKKDATNRISLNEKYFQQLSDDLENPNITEEDRLNISNERNKIAKYLDTDYKLFSQKSKELGTAEDEFDAFKRNYNALDNVSSRALYSLADAGISLYSGANYIANTLGAGEEYKQEGIKKAKDFIQEKREGFRPENKELTLDNFFQYSTDLLANQTGTLAQVGAGGIGGIVALGIEGAGNTYSQMYQDQKKGENYSPIQMALAPFVSGLSTAILSELPTVSTLKNSANVWMATLKNKAGQEIIQKAVRKTSDNIVKNIAKDTGKEIATEVADNIVQNGIKRDILGDKSVGYFDGTLKTIKDTALLTGMIASPGAMAHVAISTVKTFSDKATQQQLNSNAKKITALLSQLNNENISEISKKVIKEQIDIATKESSESINKTIDKLGKMPLEQIEEVYNNSKRISELQQEATEIKSDYGLDDVAKKTLLSGLKEEYIVLERKNTEIINQTKSVKDAKIEVPTPEAESKTEVQKQPEAEKVETPQVEVKPEVVETAPIELTPQQKIEQAKQARLEAKAKIDAKRNAPKEVVVEAPKIEQPKAEAPIVESKPKKQPTPTGKEITPNKKVNTDVETVKKELNLDDVDSFIYDNLNDTPDDKKESKVEQLKDDKFGEIDAIETKINDIDIKIEDNGIAIDKIEEDETLTPAKKKKAIAVLEKEFKDLQAQQKSLEEQKQATKDFLDIFEATLYDNGVDFNDAKIKEVVNKVNTRLETRKAVKEGTDLFPETANIAELETKKAKAKEKVSEASQVRKEAKEKPTKQDRKDIANAKIDDIVNSINSIDSIFGIKIKVDDVEGLNKNGVDIVKVIASIVKQAVSAGIEIDDAISKTIEHFKKSYDFELSDKDKNYIKNFAEPKIEPKAKVEKPQPKKQTAPQEETVSKKASELGISDAQYEKLRDDAKAIPESGEYGKYLSGETIEDVFDEPARNDQGIQTTRLQLLTQHGEQFITKAKNLFEGNYVDKTLTFLKNSNLNSFEKGVIYASMVNEANILTKEYPDNADYKAQQDAIYEDYQANLRVGALTVNSGRLIRILNAIEKGVDVGAFTGKLYSGKQKEAKQVLENAVPTPENLNKIDDEEAKIYTQEELDAEIEKAIQQEKVESKKGGIPYKPKSNAKKVKAQQAITAIEKIQKRLRSKTYDASIGVPIAIIDGGLTVIKKSIQAGVTLSEAIERGINHIKNEYGQKWAKEDEFRKDMYDEFSKEGIDVRKQPNSISKVPDVIKQALIDAGFGREVKAKKTTVDENGVKATETVVRNVLDWNKLFGNVGSIENLKRNVEEQLKKQGKTDTEIAEIQKELEAEYKRLSEKIVDKALADLERRNLITPSPNRKSDAETLALLYRQGLFNQNMDKYENVLNKALGFTTKQQDVFDEIKKQVELLNDLYEVKVDGKPLTELQMKDASNKIKRAINLLIFESVMREAPTRVGLSLAFQQILFFGMRGVLGSIHNLTENRVSSKVQIALTEFKSGVKLTNELKDLIKKAQYNVRSDMNLYGGQAYGDTSMSLLTHSIIDDIANNKIKGKILQGLYNVATLRTFLDAADSGAKVRLTMNHFITNSVNILTTKSDTRPAMSKVDAIKFVSEALTGDNFEKAKETAKNILESINEKEGKQVFKTHDQAIFRFALDIVTKNLNSGDIMTMEQIEASFKAGEASAGSSIGHNANNWLTERFNNANNSLSKHQEKALQEKEWNESMFRIAMSTLMKTGALMFRGGGTNWAVIGADKGIPLFGLAHAGYFKLAGKTKGIDLNTEIGNKYLEKELYFQGRYRDTMARAIWAIGMFTVASLVMQTKWGDDDDEETNAKKMAKWLNKPENKYFKKAFTKVSPLAFSLMVAKEGEKEELGKYLGDLFSLGDNYYDNGTQLIRSINSDQKGTTKGALGKIATSSINAPMGWKIVKDVLDIYRGLMGYPPLKNDKKAIRGFLEGAKRGGFIEWMENVNEEGIIVEPKKEREQSKKPTPTNY